MFLLDSAWYNRKKDFDSIPCEGWQRYEWTVVWDKNSKGKRVYVRFDVSGDGPVYIDNVQLE